MDSPYCHTHSSIYIHKHKSLPVPSQHLPLGSGAAVPEGAGSPAVTRAAAPWTEVLSHPLSSPRINSEASGCVDLNHRGRGAGRSRGSDFPGRAVDYISSRGLGTQISHQLLLLEEPTEQLSLSTHHVPGRRAQHRRVGTVGVGVGVDSWTPSTLAAVS